MTLTLIKDIARPHVLDIIMLLKRGRGMSVNELSAALRMSYMGVKQHCIYLAASQGRWWTPREDVSPHTQNERSLPQRCGQGGAGHDRGS